MPTGEKDTPEFKSAPPVPAHALNNYAGHYYHPGYGHIQVSVANHSLFAQTRYYTCWLKHDVTNAFRMTGKAERKPCDASNAGAAQGVAFVTDAKGRITGCPMRLDAQVPPIIFAKAFN